MGCGDGMGTAAEVQRAVQALHGLVLQGQSMALLEEGVLLAFIETKPLRQVLLPYTIKDRQGTPMDANANNVNQSGGGRPRPWQIQERNPWHLLWCAVLGVRHSYALEPRSGTL